MVQPQAKRREEVPELPWVEVDSIDLSEFFLKRWTVLQSCPFQFRSRFRQATRQVLEARSEAVTTQDVLMEGRAWKMFWMLSVLWLRKPRGQGRVGKEQLCSGNGRNYCVKQNKLCDKMHSWSDVPRRPTEERRAEAACQKVKLGEMEKPTFRSDPPPPLPSSLAPIRKNGRFWHRFFVELSFFFSLFSFFLLCAGKTLNTEP